MLVRHLRGLDPTALARQIYEEQKEQKWPGLVKETTLICQKLGIENCNEDDLEQVGTKTYRKKLVQKCKEKDEIELRKMAQGKIKCDKIMSESYGKKPYLSSNVLRKARLLFKTRTRMLPFASNYPKDRKFSKSNWLCRCTKENESESHLKSGQCEVYGDLKDKYTNLDDDNQLAMFFEDVLERRTTLEEDEKRTEDARVEGISTYSS